MVKEQHSYTHLHYVMNVGQENIACNPTKESWSPLENSLRIGYLKKDCSKRLTKQMSHGIIDVKIRL